MYDFVTIVVTKRLAKCFSVVNAPVISFFFACLMRIGSEFISGGRKLDKALQCIQYSIPLWQEPAQGHWGETSVLESCKILQQCISHQGGQPCGKFILIVFHPFALPWCSSHDVHYLCYTSNFFGVIIFTGKYCLFYASMLKSLCQQFVEGQHGAHLVIRISWVRYPSRTTSLVTLGKSHYFDCLVL
jgi:hypothetical protein